MSRNTLKKSFRDAKVLRHLFSNGSVSAIFCENRHGEAESAIVYPSILLSVCTPGN